MSIIFIWHEGKAYERAKYPAGVSSSLPCMIALLPLRSLSSGSLGEFNAPCSFRL